MTTMKEPIDPEIQSAADALAEATANFSIPSALEQAWNTLRFNLPVDDLHTLLPQSLTRSENIRCTPMSMEDKVSDVQHSDGGIGHVDAQMPSDESLGLPTPVEAACMHINAQERLLADAVACMTGVKLLRNPDGLRKAMSAVLAIMHQRSAADRVLLIVPQNEVTAWKTAALKSQDDVAVSCFVKSAATTRDCLKSLKATLPEGSSKTQVLKPRLVIAAKEFLQKKTRVLSNAPEILLQKALEEGGASRWQMVLFQCRDADLVPSSAALNLLKKRRLDSMLLFAEQSMLTERKVVQLFRQYFPTMDIEDLDLETTNFHDQSLRRPKECVGLDDRRHVLQPIKENGTVSPRRGKPPNRLFSSDTAHPKRNSGGSGVDSEMIPVSRRRRTRSKPRLKSRRESGSSPRRGSEISRRGRIKENARTSIRESLGTTTSPFDVPISPHVLMKRKTRRKSPIQLSKQVAIDTMCEKLVSNQKKQVEGEVIEVDSDFDPECFVVTERMAPPTVVHSPIVSRSTNLVQRALKPENRRRQGRSTPTKRVSPAKPRSLVFKKLATASVADRSVTVNSPLGQIASLAERRTNSFSRHAAHRNDFFSVTKVSENGISSRHTPVLSGPLARAATKRTKTVPKFTNGVPTYESASDRRSVAKTPTYESSTPRRSSSSKKDKLSTPEIPQKASLVKRDKPPASKIPFPRRSSKEMQPRQRSSCTKNEKPPMVKYAGLGLMPASIRIKYNTVLGKAKEAEKCGDEDKALELYLRCHEISDHDQILMTRILCFGGFAVGDFDFSEDGKRASLKNLSPKKFDGSRIRRRDVPKVRTQNRRNKNRAKTASISAVTMESLL